jgi:hypothetical protein
VAVSGADITQRVHDAAESGHGTRDGVNTGTGLRLGVDTGSSVRNDDAAGITHGTAGSLVARDGVQIVLQGEPVGPRGR